MKNILVLLIILFHTAMLSGQTSMSLNGEWEFGLMRNYKTTVTVPGIAGNPAEYSDSTVWYRKVINLPLGTWKYASLELKGARFSPTVFVNGLKIAHQNGGMAPIFLLLKDKDVHPGSTITLEIALKSLKDLPESDASYIAKADHWRSNISSYLWDDVLLHFHGDLGIDRIIPFTDLKSGTVKINFQLNKYNDSLKGNFSVLAEVLDFKGHVVSSNHSTLNSNSDFGRDSILKSSINLKLGKNIKLWSPESPNLYHLRLSIRDGKALIDRNTINYGAKNLKVANKKFILNGNPYTARGASVVWHRWTRDPEGRKLAYDTIWFKKNIIIQLKEHGANTLRFHLGNPPERFLDMCDRLGLLVQYEWCFFHGMPASRASLMKQWKSWLDLGMRHPSVSFIHPYNETEGDQLNTVKVVLDSLLKSYPPVILEERDVLHLHKYWWSLFENLGLYYDSADQFPKAIMADEFGGNYLDGDGNMGGYPTLKESFLRFLGRDNTAKMRLYHQRISNSQVAEYWRRIGAAGFSPFCVLGSWEDGNNWFLGKLQVGKTKPVWNALTAAWSPISVSMEIWDRNFVPSQQIELPLYLFNETNHDETLKIRWQIVDQNNRKCSETYLTQKVKSYGKLIIRKHLELPNEKGDYIIKAILENPPEYIKYPVISQWDFRIVKASVPEILKKCRIIVPNDEAELRDFLNAHDLQCVKKNDFSANILLGAQNTWKKIAENDPETLEMLNNVIQRGVSVVLLNVGPQFLGQGYPQKSGELGPLQAVRTIDNRRTAWYTLFGGLKVGFKEVAEPESHIQPGLGENRLWNHLKYNYTWLFNGLRGGLIVPAAEMELSGVKDEAFLAKWSAKGANEKLLIDTSYFAYELQGYYEYSTSGDDQIVKENLRKKVQFLIDDAPALASSLSPDSPIIITDLHKSYLRSEQVMAKNLIPLVNAGKGLTKVPVYKISFGKTNGKLILSQLLTNGRLAHGYGETGLYGIRYDEVAVQLVLNMMANTFN